MSQQVTIQYFGFEGTGRTMKDAKLNAGNKILMLHEGSFEPVLVTWRGETALIYRTLTGYESKILQHDGAPLHMPLGCEMHSEGTRKAVIKSVQQHIVQLGWRFEDPIDLFPDWFTDANDRKEAIRYRQWQLDFRKFRAEGMSENEAHLAASEAMWRPKVGA